KKALTENDITKLILFVKNILNDTNLNRYLPSALPSKNCFLYNDEASKEYLSYN
ncbi:MAG TPA: cytochrome-c peroxidase, partial [Saprospirales bacterium]|nr:cytochrome-c peroxidase [Saprospirales bacterium]